MRERPAAKVMTPGAGASPESAEAIQDNLERAQRQAELENRNQAKANKVAALLDADYYIRDKAWPFLTWDGRQLSVSEFYPEQQIAIDKFYHVDEWELSLVAHKKKVLNEHGIKYAYLTPDKTLADLEPELGI